MPKTRELTVAERQGWSAIRRVLSAFAPGSRAEILNHLDGLDTGIRVEATAITDETLRSFRKETQ